MTVLSSPQGSPERVWSLLSGLKTMGGRADRALVDDLFNPGYTVDGQSLRQASNLASDSHGAATSLGLLRLEGREALIDPTLEAATPESFSDLVHDRLAALREGDGDAPLLETYAWLAVESDRQGGVGWFFENRRDDIIDQASAAVGGQDDGGRAMNPTKWVAWRRWMSFLGLWTRLPFSTMSDLPEPTARLERELRREGVSPGTRMGAEEFLALVGRRMPYLDRGRLFLRYAAAAQHAPPERRVSPLLSGALSQLHAEGVILLQVSGDSAGVFRLSGFEGISPAAFDAVIFPAESAS